MDKIEKLDSTSFKAASEQTSNICGEVMDLIKSLTFSGEKTIKDLIKATFAAIPGSKMQAIKGEAIINTTIEECLKYDHNYKEITPDMPKDQRQGKTCRYLYFLDDEQKLNYEKMLNGQIVDGAENICYQVIDAPSSLITRREFLFMRQTKDLTENDKKKYIVASKSVDINNKFADKVVRASLFSANIYEEVENGVKVTVFYHVDPCGSIPAMIFNNLLDSQVSYIYDLKQEVCK